MSAFGGDASGDAKPALVVSGESVSGETAKVRAAQFVGQRMLGPWRWLPLGVLVVIGGAWIAVAGGIGAFGGSSDLLAASGAVALIALFMGESLALGHIRRVAARGWAARGLPGVFTLSYAIDDEALTIAGAVSTTRLKWAGVSELTPMGRGVGGKGYWIIPAAGLFFYLPRRFFPTPQAETAFVAAMLARMTPEARARSTEARKLTAFE